MKKLTAMLALAAALTLAACSAPVEQPSIQPSVGSVPSAAAEITVAPIEPQPLAATEDAQSADAGAQFREVVKQSGTSYANMPDADLDEMGMYICKHYAAGFTTQDLRDADGDRLAEAGEAALATVCKTP